MKHVALTTLFAALACSNAEITPPLLNPAACGGSGVQLGPCARIETRVFSADGSPAIAFIRLASIIDTALYQTNVPLVNGGSAVFELVQRRGTTPDTATIRIMASTPPAPHLSTYYCSIRSVRVPFARVGAVPDTLHQVWTLPAQQVSSDSECQVQP